VVFPAPLGPRNPTHLGPSSFRERFDSALNEPYDFDRLTASTEGPDTLFRPWGVQEAI